MTSAAPPAAPVLRWSGASWLEPGALCSIQQAFYPPGYAYMRHTHDYAEFFFVERGRGIHHLPGGDEPLAPGDLVFIHPTTEHALAATAAEPLVFLNIAIA